MITLEQILYVIPVLALAASITYYAVTIRNQNKTRQAQLFSQLYTLFQNIDLSKQWVDFSFIWEWNDFDDFWNKYGPEKNPDAFSYFMLRSIQMEGIGVMVKRGLLDVGLISDIISGIIMKDWEKLVPVIREYRIRQSYPHFQEYHEYLYNEVKKYKEQNP